MSDDPEWCLHVRTYFIELLTFNSALSLLAREAGSIPWWKWQWQKNEGAKSLLLTPTENFTIWKTQHLSGDVYYELQKIRQSSDSKALKLWNVRSGPEDHSLTNEFVRGTGIQNNL